MVVLDKFDCISYKIDNIDFILLPDIIECALDKATQKVSILRLSRAISDKGTISYGIYITGTTIQVYERSLSLIFPLQISRKVLEIQILLCCEVCDIFHLIERLV